MSKNNPTQQRPQNSNLPEIRFWKNKEKEIINPDLFDNIAEAWAKKLKDDNTGQNNYSQIRKYYDEVLLIEQKLTMGSKAKKTNIEEEFKIILPYLKMLRAKVYYSKNRKSQGKNLVGDNFVDFINQCLRQINDYKDFQVFKTFFEAFMGFLKYYKGD